MLDVKERQILQYLYANQERFVTSKELALHLQCSDRTIRTYMRTIDDKLLSQDGITIVAKQGYGYQLDVKNESAYRQLVATEQSHLQTATIDLNDRHNYILNKLIFEQEELLFEELMDTLFVSRSTLSADFKKIRQDLQKYHLKIESRANRGVYVIGTEHDKRHFIMDYFFSGQFLQNIHQYIGDDFLQLPISFEELTIIVLDECRSGGLKLSDFVIQNLIVHIALAISRIRSGFHISKLSIDRKRFASEIEVASHILNRVRYSTDIAFPEEEVDYIALHLISENADRLLDNGVTEIELRQDLLQATAEIDRRYGYQLGQDFTFIEGLLPHLEVLLERLHNDIHLDNPLLDDIVSQYKEAFLISRSLVSHLEHFQMYSLSDDEIAYVALHILAGMERFYQRHKLNALVICATGYGSAQMLRARLEKELGSQLNIVNLVGYYDITDDTLKDIDVIISTIDLSNLVFTIPIFTVSVFLKDYEVKKIRDHLPLLGAGRKMVSLEEGSRQLEKAYDSYFSEAYFKRYKVATKETVLDDLVSEMSQEGSNHYKTSMVELIKTRESMSTVIFDEDIAVPHPIKALDQTGKIAVAIVEEGLQWEKDYPAIRLIFLVSPSIYSNDGLSDLTKALVELTEQAELKEALIGCETFEAFRQVFLKR